MVFGGIFIRLFFNSFFFAEDPSLFSAEDGRFVLIFIVGLIFLISLIYGSWQLYKDTILARKNFQDALVNPPLNQLEANGFVFDGGFFKTTSNGFLILITYYWLSYTKEKNTYIVGILFDHHETDKKKLSKKSEELNRKYQEHIPQILFCENFVFKTFVSDNHQKPVSLDDLMRAKDDLHVIVSLENLTQFPKKTLSMAMQNPVRDVFSYLDGLI